MRCVLLAVVCVSLFLCFVVCVSAVEPPPGAGPSGSPPPTAGADGGADADADADAAGGDSGSATPPPPPPRRPRPLVYTPPVLEPLPEPLAVAPDSHNIHINNSDYQLDCEGQCPYNVNRDMQPAWVLMGGGSPNRRGLQYMVNATRGGDFVILRTYSGRWPVDWLNPVIRALGPLNSMTTICIKTPDGARNPSVLTRIANAEALFIPAGDIWEYYSTWNGSPMQIGVNNITLGGGVIGGNAEGMSLLSEFVFTGRDGPVPSPDALMDPMHERVSLGWRFVSDAPPLAKIVAESFLVARDRMGQMVALLARVIFNGWVAGTEARGFGMDDGTCVIIDKTGTAKAMGVGSLFFLQSTHDPEIVEAHAPLTFTAVRATRYDLTPSGLTWQWNTWAPPGALSFDLDVNNGLFAQDNRYGPDGPIPGPPS